MASKMRTFSGSKLVITAVAGTIGFVGVGTIYLPFIADKDKIRGLHEEQHPPTAAMLAQEIKKLQQEGILGADDQEDQKPEEEKKVAAPGSMWKRFKK
jgi:hypothetical protein